MQPLTKQTSGPLTVINSHEITQAKREMARLLHMATRQAQGNEQRQLAKCRSLTPAIDGGDSAIMPVRPHAVEAQLEDIVSWALL